MQPIEYPYAGLILPDATDLDPVPYLDTAAKVLDQLDAVPGAAVHRLAHGNRAFGRRFGIIVTPEEDSDYGPRVLIEIITRNGAIPEDERAANILSDVVLACLAHCDADIIEWYSPDVLLDRDDFIRLRSYVSPRRLQELDEDMADDLFDSEQMAAKMLESLYGAPKPLSVDERPKMTDRLAHYRINLLAREPLDRRRSVTGHLVTGIIGVIYFTLAAFIYIVSFGRDMDLRLVSQALAITALFTALYNADRLGGVLNQIIH
ncbi:hypothetical protein J4E08_01065 [Sagittula sp. NFXS13]|uniref:hypothetical protein n=1 Tax=Sagittula sp. NFXS13 TaxID=2819095 RepID=UPI0032E05741